MISHEVKTVKNDFCSCKREASLIGTAQSSKGPPRSFACPCVTSAAAPLSVCELCSGAGRVSAESETGREIPGSLMWLRQTHTQTHRQTEAEQQQQQQHEYSQRDISQMALGFCTWATFASGQMWHRKMLFLSEIKVLSFCPQSSFTVLLPPPCLLSFWIFSFFLVNFFFHFTPPFPNLFHSCLWGCFLSLSFYPVSSSFFFHFIPYLFSFPFPIYFTPCFSFCFLSFLLSSHFSFPFLFSPLSCFLSLFLFSPFLSCHSLRLFSVPFCWYLSCPSDYLFSRLIQLPFFPSMFPFPSPLLCLLTRPIALIIFTKAASWLTRLLIL